MNSFASLNFSSRARSLSSLSMPALRQVFVLAIAVAFTVVLTCVTHAAVISFAPGDYDNTQNQVNAGPTPVNNQTTGLFRDIFWWGSANGVGDNDYINSGKNLISNGGSPARAVV